MTHKVLFVDDSVQLLSAIKRRLRKHLDLTTADSAVKAMKLIEDEGPFAVIVTDQNMPGMDGISLLELVEDQCPDTVRIMMTGQHDKDITLRAINDSHVFRLLTKPCTPDDVLSAVQAGLERFNMRFGERQLLEETLSGSVKMLLDVVHLNSAYMPDTSKRRHWAKAVSKFMPDIDPWALDLAVMLSSLGLITLPADITKKLTYNEPLSQDEKMIIEQCPTATRDLLSNIPRLEPIAIAIYYQHKNYDGTGFPYDTVKESQIPKISRLLKILEGIETYQRQTNDSSIQKAFSELRRNIDQYDPGLLEKVKEILLAVDDTQKDSYEVISVDPMKLAEGDKILEDVRTQYDSLVLKAGQTLSAPMIFKICQIHKHTGIDGQIKLARRALPADHKKPALLSG